MTTGTLTIGYNPSDYYFKKQWSGVDGKYDASGNAKWNDYSMSLTEVVTKQSKVMCFEGVPCSHYCYSYGYMIPGSNPPVVPWSSNDDLILLGRLSEKIRRHDFDMGNFIGEGKQTVESVLGVMRTLYESVRLVKRGRPHDALRALVRASATGLGSFENKQSKRLTNTRFLGKTLSTKDVGGAWLSMQYAWLPLLSDVYSSAKAFEALSSKPRSQIYEASLTRKSSGEASYYPNDYSLTSKSSRVDRYRYMLTEELTNARSLGLLDPVGVAWELIPFSFVADWFLPIGSYLDALSVYPFLTGKWVKSSYYRSEQHLGAIKSSRWNCDTHKFDAKQVTLTRSVGTEAIQVPTPTFNNPWKALQAGNRIENSAALLRNLFK